MKVEKYALVTNKIAIENADDLSDAREFLEWKVSTSDEIVVISAFYGEEFVKTVLANAEFSGRGRLLTLVFAGLPEVARAEQIASLRDLKTHIVTTHRFAAKNVDIRLVLDTKFLHAKVIRFRTEARSPVYVIGSANFSTAAYAHNDEAMVAITGRHPGLNSYIAHVLKCSYSLEEIPDEQPASTWRDLLRNGYLYFRPNRTLGYTVDPFNDEEFKDVAERLRQQSNPLPFSAGSALGLNLKELLELEEPAGNTKLGFRLPTYAVETDYGYWVPKPYVDFIESILEQASKPKFLALQKRGKELSELGDAYVTRQIAVYLDEVQNRVGAGSSPLTISKQQRVAIEEKIVRRVNHLKAMLTDPKSLERLSETMIGAPVPEFWEDNTSVTRFFEGFCYDIVSKLSAPKRVPMIIAHLADEFGIAHGDNVEACQQKISSFFAAGNAWPNDKWPQVSDLED